MKRAQIKFRLIDFSQGNNGFFRNITLIITISVFWEYTKKNMQQEKEGKKREDRCRVANYYCCPDR